MGFYRQDKKISKFSLVLRDNTEHDMFLLVPGFMLGRRHYRIKVFQALYAWFQGGEIRLDVSEKTLLQSINKIIELYYLQISFFLEAIEFYRMRSEDAKNKFYPTEEELNPNLKLLTEFTYPFPPAK